VRLRKSEFNPALDGERLMSFNVNDKTIPDSWDWREKGFITDHENQKTCGSCYAYSIAYTVMGQVFRRISRVVPLSWQQIVDCSTSSGNQGCQGGSLRITLKYLENSGGIMRNEDYPYTATHARCKFRKDMVVANISSWAILPPKDEMSLRAAIYQVGPVAVSINAAPQSFQLYSEGIYNDNQCTSKTVNHAMVAVGYTPEYFILKNWWSKSWGENGYMRIKRHSNLCGMANYAAYSVI
jgi:C1A family cysteine protease